jgi:hypothetical protein
MTAEASTLAAPSERSGPGTALPPARCNPGLRDDRAARPDADAPPRSVDQLPDVEGAEELAGHFVVDGHRLRLRTHYWRRLPKDAALGRRWHRLAGKARFFHVQQAGRTPTFVGVACGDVELGRQFTVELLCGGWGWHTLRRSHCLFVVEDSAVNAYEGSACRRDPAMAELATGHVLPRARDEVIRLAGERRRAAAAAASLAADGWLAARWRAATFSGETSTCAVARRDGKAVLITGATALEEASALAGELAQGHLWRPERHGHLHLHFGTSGLELTSERGDARGAGRMLGFARRFCRYVIISDLHLGVPPRDTFGAPKGDLLAALIQRVVRDRSTLVLNGDFLELLHERYGVIRRAYPEVFRLLPQVRRLVYVAGNHDDDILRENIKLTRRSTRKTAVHRAYAKVQSLAPGGVEMVAIRPEWGVRRAADWARFLSDRGLLPALEEILNRRQGTIWLSRGFPGEGLAFQRLGPRDTDAERPQWYFDESLLDHPVRVSHLLKLLADRRQRLDRILQRDWGDHLRVLRYFWDPARGLYCEHGHFAMPECHGNRLGRTVGVAAGWSKRIGLRQIEHWFEEHLGGWLRVIHPFDRLREIRQFAERQLAVASVLSRLGGSPRRPTLICSHTHEVAAAGEGPVHAFVNQATGASYANTGAWSSRFRLKRAGHTRVEWLEVDAGNRVHPRAGVTADD